jgi:hypothetical protein
MWPVKTVETSCNKEPSEIGRDKLSGLGEDRPLPALLDNVERSNARVFRVRGKVGDALHEGLGGVTVDQSEQYKFAEMDQPRGVVLMICTPNNWRPSGPAIILSSL